MSALPAPGSTLGPPSDKFVVGRLVDNDEGPEANMARLARVGRQQKPTIALWGTADTDVPFALHTTLLEHIPHCTLHMFEDESHMFFQKAELVPKIAAIIAEFVQG